MHPSRMGLVDLNRTAPGIGMHPSRMGLVDINRGNPNTTQASRGGFGFTSITRETAGKSNFPQDGVAEPVKEKEPCPPEPGTEGDEGGRDSNWFFMSLGRPEGPVTWPELWEKCAGTSILVFRKGSKDWMSIYDVMSKPTAEQVFYFKDGNGEECGPTTKQKVLSMEDSTEVWKSGWESWSTVEKLKTLESEEVVALGEDCQSESTFAIGSHVEIKDTSHVYKTINRSTFLDPWPEIDDLKSPEVKLRAGQDYWKKIGFEIKTGVQGKVIYEWKTYGCETRLVQISAGNENALVPVKVEGLKLVTKEVQSKKRALDTNDSTEPGDAKAKERYQEGIKEGTASSKKFKAEKEAASGFASWLGNQGY